MAKAETNDRKPPTKTEIFAAIAEKTDLAKKDVSAVFDALGEEIEKALSKRGPGQFTIPGLCKITVVDKPATKEHERPDPFRPGEMMVVRAKPASRQVKVRPLKGLKDMV